MKKVLLVMCFLGATNLFADTCNGFCSSVVFENESAYIKPDVVPVMKALCDKYAVFEPVCSVIDFRPDGSAWVQESAVETFRQYCTAATKEEDESFWNRLLKGAATINWRH